MKKYEHGGDLYGTDFEIDFSVNINPLGMPESTEQRLRNILGRCTSYPDPECRDLVKKLSLWEGVPEENILCGNGAADIIYRAVFAVKPKKAAIFSPTFSEYERALEAIDCEICHIMLSEENDFTVTPEDSERIPDDADMVFICSPNNPTGQAVSHEALSAICEKCGRIGARLIADECFIAFCEEEEAKTAKDFLDKGILIIKAFTKIFAMPGLRLGYALCIDRELLDKMYHAGPDWSVSVPAQLAGCAVLEDEEYIAATKIYVARERRYLTEALENMGCRVFPSDGNFLLIRTKLPVAETLAEKRMVCRSCDNFPGLDEHYYRIAVRSHADNVKLVVALSKEAGKCIKVL